MFYEGGPAPVYPSIREVSEEERLNPHFVYKKPEDDKEWKDLVAAGGAGDNADSKEVQKARYQSSKCVDDSPELYPGASKYVLRPPDLIVTSSNDYTIKTFDCHKNYALVQTFEGHLSFVNETKSCRGTTLLSAGDDYTLRLWRRGKSQYGELLMTYYINRYPMKTCAPLPGKRAICGGLDKVLRVVSLLTGHTLHRIVPSETGVNENDDFFQREGCGAIWCTLHVKENVACNGSDDGTLRFWDIDKGTCLGKYSGHKGYGTDMGKSWEHRLSREFAPIWKVVHLGDNGNRLATCSYDRTIAIWNCRDPRDAKVIRNWKAADNAVLNIALVGDKELATCSADKEFQIWNFETGDLLRKMRINRGFPMACAYLNDNVLALCGGDTTIRVIDWSGSKKDDFKDLVGGENGFNAHEFIITDCHPIYYADEDPANWTTNAIMYRSIKKEAGEDDSASGLDLLKSTFRDAVEFVDK